MPITPSVSARKRFQTELDLLLAKAGSPHQVTVAKQAGLRVTTVNNWFKGVSVPTTRTSMDQLLRVLARLAVKRRLATESTFNKVWLAQWEQWRLEARRERPQPPPPVPLLSNEAGTLAEFRANRTLLGNREQIGTLIRHSLKLHEDLRYDPHLPLLTKPDWVPATPLTLGDVRLTYVDPGDGSELVRARDKLVQLQYWPAHNSVRPHSYSAAVTQHDAPPHWFNGRSYRLLNMESTDRGLHMRLTEGYYFEAFDTTEPLGYEAALCFRRSNEREIRGPYRDWLDDPFNLTARCGIPGVNTLTIRRCRKDAMFYLNLRTGTATALGTRHVVPAGEFQPHRDSDRSMAAQMSLRSTMVREYGEELLGLEEVRDDKKYVDIERQEPYASIHRAFDQGDARAYVLGVGLYPLTWKPEILLVCIFDERVFDRIFARMVVENPEGVLVKKDRLTGMRQLLRGRRNRPYQGLTWDEATVVDYAGASSTLPAARGCLHLAWRHRRHLGLDFGGK